MPSKNFNFEQMAAYNFTGINDDLFMRPGCDNFDDNGGECDCDECDLYRYFEESPTAKQNVTEEKDSILNVNVKQKGPDNSTPKEIQRLDTSVKQFTFALKQKYAR